MHESGSSDDFWDDVPMYIGEASIDAVVVEAELFMIETEIDAAGRGGQLVGVPMLCLIWVCVQLLRSIGDSSRCARALVSLK